MTEIVLIRFVEFDLIPMTIVSFRFYNFLIDRVKQSGPMLPVAACFLHFYCKTNSCRSRLWTNSMEELELLQSFINWWFVNQINRLIW